MAVVNVLMLAVALALGPQAEPPGIAWEKDLGSALKRAKKERRIVMVDFWAEWCEWCHLLEKNTYTDPHVVEGVREMVAVKVDTEGGLAEMEATERFEVDVLPTILFLTPDGIPLLRVTDFQDAQHFARTLEQVRAESERPMALD